MLIQMMKTAIVAGALAIALVVLSNNPAHAALIAYDFTTRDIEGGASGSGSFRFSDAGLTGSGVETSQLSIFNMTILTRSGLTFTFGRAAASLAQAVFVDGAFAGVDIAGDSNEDPAFFKIRIDGGVGNVKPNPDEFGHWSLWGPRSSAGGLPLVAWASGGPQFVDFFNRRVEDPDPAPVSAPATGALMLGGFAAAGFVARRRRRTA